jgi:hypothetical protein
VEETLEEEKETDEKLIELAKEILSHGTYDSEAIAILSNVEIGYQHVELATSHFGKCFGYASRNSYFKTGGWRVTPSPVGSTSDRFRHCFSMVYRLRLYG